jgi:protein-disulfide isomerase
MATKTQKPTPPVEEQAIQSPEEYVTFKATHFYSVLVGLAFAVGILVGYMVWGRNAAVTASPAPVAAADQPAVNNAPAAGVIVSPTPQRYVRYEIPTEGFPSLGPDDAEIVIVEFSDYQCPFCSRFHDQTYRALLDAYPGQIRFVYRNLPLSFHQNAMPAAEAAMCAGDQDAYWEMHDKLFENQASLNNQEGMVLDQPTYNQYATELGLDVTVFEECMTSHRHVQAIQDDMEFSQSLGVQSTPTFFINGLAIVGAQPLANFQQLIDMELAGEIPEN